MNTTPTNATPTPTAVITGCARNISAKIIESLYIISNICNIFSDYAVIIVENDSTDTTPHILNNWARKQADKRHIIQLGKLDNMIPFRTDRLAFVRNYIMDMIHNHPVFSTFDYIINIDLDGILTRAFDVEKLQGIIYANYASTSPSSSSSSAHAWDAIFPNCNREYYDIWALRSNALGITTDCWNEYNKLRHKNIPVAEAKKRAIGKWQVKIVENTEPIPVESAFGGMGIYRLKKTVGCKYVGRRTIPGTNMGEHCCEHVPFHADMIKKHGARLFIYPSLVVETQDEHVLRE